MLRNVKESRGFAIRATDGVIGEVDDLYFDDENWAVRYLVVETGGWLSGRKVLISPYAIGLPIGTAGNCPSGSPRRRSKAVPTLILRNRSRASTRRILLELLRVSVLLGQ